MQQYTLIYPLSKDGRQILLGLYKAGRWSGYWNGFGGQLEPNENATRCAQREISEELNIFIKYETNMNLIANIGIYHDKDNPTIHDVSLHVFVTSESHWIGTPTPEDPKIDTLQWFSMDKVLLPQTLKYTFGIPYQAMPETDILWLPQALKYGSVSADITFFPGSDIVGMVEFRDVGKYKWEK